MTGNSMTDDHVQSRPSPGAPVPDAHGQAALLLAESTLHALLDAGVLTLDQAIGAVSTAAEVKVNVADDLQEPDGRMEHSLELLAAIKMSLDSDSDQPGLHLV